MIQYFIDSFSNLTPILWVSQICGLIGFALILISYQFKKKIFLITSSVALVFFLLEQTLALLFSVAIVTLAILVFTIWMGIYAEKTGKTVPVKHMVIGLVVVWVIEILYIVVTPEFFSLDMLIPPFFFCIKMLTQNSSNEYVFKIGAGIQEGAFLIYFLYYNLPLSVIRQASLVISIVISISLLLIHSYQNKNRVKKDANQ